MVVIPAAFLVPPGTTTPFSKQKFTSAECKLPSLTRDARDNLWCGHGQQRNSTLISNGMRKGCFATSRRPMQ